MKKESKAFTLVEVIITIAILGLIFTSVMTIFIFYSSLGAKVETNRLIQSNVKTIVEHISEDVAQNGIDMSQHAISPGKLYETQTDSLHVGGNHYYIGQKIAGKWLKVDTADFVVKCQDIKLNCLLIKDTGSEKIPLSNTWISFNSAAFHVSGGEIPKVTMNFDISIASGKGVQVSLIKNSSITTQTTISEKLLDK